MTTTRKIYGVSSSYTLGGRDCVYVFDDMKTAMRWLNTEEGGFRFREIMTKTAAVKGYGKKAVEYACRVVTEDGRLVKIPFYDAD